MGLRTVEITQKQEVQLWVLSGQILKIFDFFFRLFAFGDGMKVHERNFFLVDDKSG